MSKKFKGATGKWFTIGLFYEFNYVLGDATIFTVHDQDIEVSGRKLKSLKKLYLGEGDPTGYNVATKYLGGWQHWKTMLKNPAIKAMVKEWEEELEVKLRSEGLRQIVNDASDDTRTSISSAKFLVNKGWVPAETKVKDRKKEKEQKHAIQQEFEDDFKRLQIN